MSRNIIFWIIFIVLALAAEGLIFVENNKLEKENRALWSAFNANAGLAKVEIVFEGGQKRLFVGNLEGKTFPLRLSLESIAETGNFSLTAGQEKIEKLDGLGERGVWKIYRNQKLQTGKLDQLTIAGGDIYSLRFER